MILGVILSHTKMKDGYFCTNIVIKLKNGTYKQIRPFIGGKHLRYDYLGNKKFLIEEWQAGRFVNVKLGGSISPRITHPEDTSVLSLDLKTPYRNVGNLDQIVSAFTFDTINDLFPKLVENEKYTRVEPQERSVGYVRNVHLSIREDNYNNMKAHITDSDNHVISYLPISGVRLLNHLEEVGALYMEGVTIRLSLADSYVAPNKNEPYCYLMLSEVILPDGTHI